MKLYVGNLPYTVTEQDVKETFLEYGEVTDVVLITDKSSGQSKGFGFVEMADDSARSAIEDLNESEIEGRKLTVNEARDRKRR